MNVPTRKAYQVTPTNIVMERGGLIDSHEFDLSIDITVLLIIHTLFRTTRRKKARLDKLQYVARSAIGTNVVPPIQEKPTQIGSLF